MLIKALRYVCPENIGKLDAFALGCFVTDAWVRHFLCIFVVHVHQQINHRGIS